MALQRHCKSWTAIEDAVVRELSHAFSNRQIAELLGRAETAVSNRWKTKLHGDIIEKNKKIDAKYATQLNSGEAIKFTNVTDVAHAQNEFKLERIQIKVNDDKTITETLKFNHRSDAIKYALVMAQEWEDMCDVDGDQSAPSSPERALKPVTQGTPSTPSQQTWTDEDIANAVGYYNAAIPIEEIAAGLGKDIDDTYQKIQSIIEPQTIENNDNHNRSNPSNTNNKVKVALPRRPTDKHAPKRPMNSFFVFAHKNRSTLIVKGRGAVSEQKVIAQKWNELSDRDKVPYQEEAKRLQKDYKRKTEAYVKTEYAKQFQAKLREWKAECDRKKRVTVAKPSQKQQEIEKVKQTKTTKENNGKAEEEFEEKKEIILLTDENNQTKTISSGGRKRKLDDSSNSSQPPPKKRKIEPKPIKVEPNDRVKSRMSVEQVADWICSLGQAYAQYKKTWIEDGIDGLLMDSLNEDLLCDMVTKKIHAKKIALEWANL
eukprot:143982_1